MYNDLYPKKYYLFLEGFRGYAILWIILHHINIFFDLRPVFGRLSIYAYMFAEIGFLGVDTFFVISGFLITGILLGDLGRGINLKRFYVRRAFKIIPPYLLTVFAALLVLKFISPFAVEFRQLYSYSNGEAKWTHALLSSHGNASSIYYYFLFLQNYAVPASMAAHLWAVAIEAHFYLIYPLIMIVVCKLVNQKQLCLRVLIGTLAGLIIGGNIIRYVSIEIFMTAPFQATHFRFDALLFGGLIKLLEPQIRGLNKDFAKIVSPLCCLSGLVIFAAFYLDGFNKAAWSAYALAYLAPGLLLVSALMGCPGMNILTENKLLTWIGQNSYGTYLWHYMILFLLSKYGLPVVNFPMLFVYLVCVLFAGYLSTQTIERYFLKIRQKCMP